MNKIKAIAVIATIVALPVQAGELTKDEYEMCVSAAELAEAIAKRKQRGDTKREVYAVNMGIEGNDSARNLANLITDGVYNGSTPDEVFDQCIKARRKS